MPEIGISETTICNRALVRIGAKPIAQYGDQSSDKGTAIALLYPEIRDQLLAMLRWNFARRWATLAQLLTAPLNLALLPDPDYSGRIMYSGQYQLPQDYLRLSAVSPYDSHWRVVGTALYTDAAPSVVTTALVGLQPLGGDGADNQPALTAGVGGVNVGIEYIAKVTDATQFSAPFAMLLAKTLAAELCFSTNALENMRDKLANEAKALFEHEAAVEGMQQWPEQLFDTVMVDVRYGYSSSGSAGSLFS